MASQGNNVSLSDVKTRTLFSFPISPFGRAVHAILLSKGLETDVRQIPFEMTKSEGYLSTLNPRGKVPVLVDFPDGPSGKPVVLYESLAIAEYLEWKYPSPALMPSATQDRAAVMVKMGEVTSILPAVVPIVVETFVKGPKDQSVSAVLPKWQQFSSEMEFWESALLKSGKFLTNSSTPTLADYVAYPMFAFMMQIGYKEYFDEKLPAISKYVAEMEKLDVVKQTLPPIELPDNVPAFARKLVSQVQKNSKGKRTGILSAILNAVTFRWLRK